MKLPILISDGKINDKIKNIKPIKSITTDKITLTFMYSLLYYFVLYNNNNQ